MSDKAPEKWSQWWDGLCRRHPLWLWMLVLALAFVTAPLMIAAGRMTAVLYKDF